MRSLDLWEELNQLPEPLIEYDNDTELSLGELLDMQWTETQTEKSNYSSMTATTFVEPSGKYAKKVYSDGFVEFYELA
jgi:hypothetical protein